MKKLNTYLLLFIIAVIAVYYYIYLHNKTATVTIPAPTEESITYIYRADQVLNNEVYTSYFNNTLHEPLYVVYKLYQGGGDCPRKHMHFKTGGLAYSATLEDYKHSQFDQGHLCPAEDEAFDCEREELTFRFYNCLPQTPNLNRGVWKTWETTVRQESQRDSLLVLCGGIFGSSKIGGAAVPDYCWKLVYNLTTKRVLHCLIFPNDDSNTVERSTVNILKHKVGYPLVLPF